MSASSARDWAGSVCTLSPPSLDIVSNAAVFEVTPAGQLVWMNRPVAPDPTPRLTTSELTKPLPQVAGYVVGVGKAEVTDLASKDELSELPMQGWAQSGQKSSGIESELYARGFIVADPATQQRIVMVVADIWSCSIALKEAVIERLQQGNAEVPYRTDNVFIAGTHTHSAHAGFLHHLLYNLAGGGFDPHVFECFVRGIVRAIELAHQDLSPGAVYVNEGDITGLTRNRSMPAFRRNPSSDRAAFPNAVDERMTLLKFVRRKPQSRDETAIGVLTWFAIHPTNRGKKNLLINGDNKGAASAIFESGAARLPGNRQRVNGGVRQQRLRRRVGKLRARECPKCVRSSDLGRSQRYPPRYGSDGVCGPGPKRQGGRTVHERHGRAGRPARDQASAHRSAARADEPATWASRWRQAAVKTVERCSFRKCVAVLSAGAASKMARRQRLRRTRSICGRMSWYIFNSAVSQMTASP